MKHYSCLFLVLVLFGCEDAFKDVYRYSKIISQSKEYPVYLDMSEIAKIQVKSSLPQVAPFKIVSNDKYYFVGDKLKGIHVYEKKAGSVSYLCFIECGLIKDLDITGNWLFCNNFTDLVVLDVSNPLQTNILHRQINHFNRYSSYKEAWNIPWVEGKGLIAGMETHVLTGTVTDKQPELDFTAYDSIYGNITTTELPDSWFSEHPENDKPHVGIMKMNTDEIYTYGTYNSWAICTFREGTFIVREENLWTEPRGKYAPPYYYADANPVRMFSQDSLIHILGTAYGYTGYSDCIVYHELYPTSYHLYFPNFMPLDITYMPALKAFIVLTGQSVGAAFISSESAYMKSYLDYQVQTDATAVFRMGNKVFTLGSELKVYLPSENELQIVKEYPEITGTCYSISGNVLALANTQGLFLYDVTEPENIKLIP